MRASLVGLLVAMTICSLLVLSLLPLALTTHQAMAVERSGEELARELQAARQLAITTGESYRVLFDRVAKAYYIMAYDIQAPCRCVQLEPGVEWVGISTNPIYFSNTGRCITGGTYSLTYRDSRYRVEIIVATHSGRVRVERRPP